MVGPTAFAATSPVASIANPADGAVIVENSTVRIAYSGYSAGAQNISGYLMLDGDAAGTFFAKVSSANSTTFNATLAGASFASGAHALSARVFTERDNPVDTPAIVVTLDKAPVITNVTHAYDLDARALVVSAQVTDDGGPSNVTLVSGANRTSTSTNGALNLTLARGVGPGNYTATLTANDTRGQSTRVAIAFVVVDREAQVGTLEARHVLGARLLVRANLTDADGIRRVYALTALGNGSLGLENGTWSGDLSIDPRLGTFNGTLVSDDAWGGETRTPFTFTVGGERVVLFERTVATHTGAYADELDVAIPAALNGTFEICVDGCETNGTSVSVGNGTAYGTLCAMRDNPQCRVLTGRPLIGGSFAVCEPGALSPLRTAVAVLDAAGEVALRRKVVCHDYFASEINATSALFSNRTIEWNDVAIVARYDGAAPNATFAGCSSFGTDETCRFEAPRGLGIDLTWAQGIERTVVVRATGIRV